MKVSDADLIKSSERELMDLIIAELDWAAIERLLFEKHGISLQDEVNFKEGDLVVHQGKIAYKLSFDVKISLDVLFDRSGDCVLLSAAGSEEVMEEKDELPEKEDIKMEDEKNMEIASDLLDIVEEINTEDS